MKLKKTGQGKKLVIKKTTVTTLGKSEQKAVQGGATIPFKSCKYCPL